MSEPLRCPVCGDVLRAGDELDGGAESRRCLTCDLRAPRHVAELLAADRAELVRLRNGFAEGVTPLNRALNDLAEQLRERARGAERTAAMADDVLDVPMRDRYRERSTSFRVAARLVAELITGEEPRKAGHG